LFVPAPPPLVLLPPGVLPEPLDELPEPVELPLLPDPVDVPRVVPPLLVPLVPAGRPVLLPDVPIPELPAPQFADSIRTEVTRTCCVLVSAEAVEEVEDGEDDRRALRDAVRCGGMIVPRTSTCCPSWP
jgi:hypothetical protein